MATQTRKEKATPLADAFFARIDPNDCINKDDLHLLRNKKILSLSDYESWISQPHRGRNVQDQSEKERFLKILFSALDMKAAIVKLDLSKYKFDVSRQKFNSSYIQYAYQFFDKYVQDYCIGRSWQSDTFVIISINPTAGKSHGHRKSYR